MPEWSNSPDQNVEWGLPGVGGAEMGRLSVLEDEKHSGDGYC